MKYGRILIAVNITSMMFERQNKRKKKKKSRICSKEQRSSDRLFFLLFVPHIKINLDTLKKKLWAHYVKNFNVQY